MTDHSQHPIAPPINLIKEWYASADDVGENVIKTWKGCLELFTSLLRRAS